MSMIDDAIFALNERDRYTREEAIVWAVRIARWRRAKALAVLYVEEVQANG